MVWKPSRMFGSPYRIFGSDREALQDVRKWSEDPCGCPGVVWRPFRMLEWLGCPPGSPGVLGRPSQMSGSGREILPDVPEWWEALLDVRQLSRGPRMSGRPSRLSGSHRETIPDVQE